jgi:hypothetical protein
LLLTTRRSRTIYRSGGVQNATLWYRQVEEMPRLSVIALLALVAVTGLAAAGLAQTSAPPSLRPVKLSPLQLKGVNFKAGERVHLTLRVGRASMAREERATRTGVFMVDFGLVAIEPCAGSDLLVRAVGNRGSRASYKRPCKPAHEQPSLRKD